MSSFVTTAVGTALPGVFCRGAVMTFFAAVCRTAAAAAAVCRTAAAAAAVVGVSFFFLFFYFFSVLLLLCLVPFAVTLLC